MIRILSSGPDQEAAAVVHAAMTRSCGMGSARHASFAECMDAARLDQAGIWCVINPPSHWTPVLQQLLQRRAKLVVFGRLAQCLAAQLQTEVQPLDPSMVNAAGSENAPSHGSAESAGRIKYRAEVVQQIAAQSPNLPERALLRYDFTDEWNNLGYGAVRADGGLWSLSQAANVPAGQCLAELVEGDLSMGAYAGLWPLDASSVIWFNRAVGPVDSQEWRYIEDFISCHRPGELPCIPVLAEVPSGFDAAVTMRLDCDEDVESARHLWSVYQSESIPFSLALHSKVLADDRHHALPKDVLAHGGALLSHTATHAPDWGGSHAAALAEGLESARAIEAATGHKVTYAVSPFHQTPIYARHGLADAGYRGCIGGIIRNDPDFLTGRAGVAPGSASGFIGHSQQCMLHGECMVGTGDPIQTFKQAFDLAKLGGAFFGYLDHPFSERYQYGWENESQREQAHRDLIRYMRDQGNTLFLNEEDAMNHLHDKAHVEFQPTPEGMKLTPPAVRLGAHPIGIRFKGQRVQLAQAGVVL